MSFQLKNVDATFFMQAAEKKRRLTGLALTQFQAHTLIRQSLKCNRQLCMVLHSTPTFNEVKLRLATKVSVVEGIVWIWLEAGMDWSGKVLGCWLGGSVFWVGPAQLKR